MIYLETGDESVTSGRECQCGSQGTWDCVLALSTHDLRQVMDFLWALVSINAEVTQVTVKLWVQPREVKPALRPQIQRWVRQTPASFLAYLLARLASWAAARQWSCALRDSMPGPEPFCHHLKSLTHLWTSTLHFHFSMNQTNHVSGSAFWKYISCQVSTSWKRKKSH